MSEVASHRGPGYRRRVHLARAVDAIRAGQLERAEAEIEAAIDLDPGAPEAYWLRSSVCRQSERYADAARDWARCLSLDPHFLEAETLETAVARVLRALLTDPILDAGRACAPAGGRLSPEPAAFLDERVRAVGERRKALTWASCSLPCPSQCCYIDEDPFIFVEPGKIEAVRAVVRERGLRESERIGRASAAECVERVGEERTAAILCAEEGEPCAYYLRRDERAMPLAYRDRPRRLDGHALPWLTAASRACSFVGANGCELHQVGDPPGLGICRAFLCLTGFVFCVLRHLGVVSSAALASRQISDLHEQALRLLPQLDEFFVAREASPHQAIVKERLVDAIEADVAGARDRVAAEMAACRAAAQLLSRDEEVWLEGLRKAVTSGGNPRNVNLVTSSDVTPVV